MSVDPIGVIASVFGVVLMNEIYRRSARYPERVVGESRVYRRAPIFGYLFIAVSLSIACAVFREPHPAPGDFIALNERFIIDVVFAVIAIPLAAYGISLLHDRVVVDRENIVAIGWRRTVVPFDRVMRTKRGTFGQLKVYYRVPGSSRVRFIAISGEVGRLGDLAAIIAERAAGRDGIAREPVSE